MPSTYSIKIIISSAFLILLILALTGLLISGGMMSLDKFQETMLVIHRVSMAVFLVCYLALGYILLTYTIQLKQ